ncbi:polyribonucleotide nucleotidyltransferase [Coriobacteriia bacterium Es71-Z0120]|uniref:polyribonucleotide nucleotidyltransferase n=1 Tax=Parvivirga hydrogeniphila TaxID=2939460 RepID=UPI002260F6DA|nr:polyribonucleotide nucleotidyltransferase [Parvivirga hydrogeniphila]MCL4079606.1 polyribonucleotide nucleotidyltransferase [Parvivirga hydrogeniphila]
MGKVTEQFELYGKHYTLETGELAKQAGGAVVVRQGDSVVLVTAVASKESKDLDFFPLTVDFEERMYAAGKLPGGFIKREARPSEKAILTARMIDRPIRAAFADGFRNEVQIIATVLSADQEHQVDVISIMGASAALMIAGVPFEGPLAGVRIARTADGEWLVNPTFEETEDSDIDLVVAGSKDAIFMVEAGAKMVSEEDMLAALEFAQTAIAEFCAVQQRFLSRIDITPMEVALDEPPVDLWERVRALGADKMRQALHNPDKHARMDAVAAVKEEIKAAFSEEELAAHGKHIKALLKRLEKETMRAMVLDEGERADGRGLTEIRPISCVAGYLPRSHGSGLFTRGQTQVLSVLTLGMLSEWQRIDTIDVMEGKRYLHHYNFPPFCTGEIGFMRGPKRRDIGHGALAERALLPVIPPEEEFPYTIRIVSEVLESNGSSSMASVCGSTLALMDAGVPIKAPVSGVAMGLIKEGDRVAVLTDIQGLEDFLGDMDFKVAGTADGITALQMDNKAKGLSVDILRQALMQAKEARAFILGKMLEAIPEPRPDLSPYAPRVITIKIPTDKIRDVIGPGGKMIRSIIEATGAEIDVNDDGTVYVASRDAGGLEAVERIKQLTRDVEVGERFTGRVVAIQPFGAFVELLPGRDGLLHISRMAKGRLAKVEDVLNVGDEVEVVVLEIDDRGKVSLDAVNKFDVPEGSASPSAPSARRDDAHGHDRRPRRRR